MRPTVEVVASQGRLLQFASIDRAEKRCSGWTRIRRHADTHSGHAFETTARGTGVHLQYEFRKSADLMMQGVPGEHVTVVLSVDRHHGALRLRFDVYVPYRILFSIVDRHTSRLCGFSES